MNRDAIVLALIFAVLAAVVLARFAPPAEVAEAVVIPEDETQTSALAGDPSKGPSYLTYNFPYMFAPPVSNFLPSQAAPGQAGAQITVGTPIQPCGASCIGG